MRTLLNSGFLITLTLLLIGCGSTQPPPPPQPLTNMEPFKIIVPKDLNSTDTWGINFNSHRRVRNGSTYEIGKHFVVGHQKVSQNEMKTNFCNTETYSSTGRTHSSCVTVTSDVEINDLGDSSEIMISPKLKTNGPKGGTLIFTISHPDLKNEHLYSYFSSHKVSHSGKITSSFPSESIKGNFDRLAKKFSWNAGQSDSAHRQFKDTYLIKTSNGIEGIVSAGFFPYRDGSIVQYVVEGVSKGKQSIREVDWNEAMKEIEEKIQKIVNS